jgi:hypothetical protein
MTTATVYPNVADLAADDYIVIGLATCFIKQDGEVHQVQIAEPIPAAAIEALVKGIPTSYQLAYGTTLGAIFTGETVTLPAEFPADTQLCDDFAERSTAAARTYKKSQAAQSFIPVGTSKSDFNFSTDRKRVLNSDRIVKAEDNVKQHAYTHQVL